jgi:hypothetical protein
MCGPEKLGSRVVVLGGDGNMVEPNGRCLGHWGQDLERDCATSDLPHLLFCFLA